MSKQGNTLQLSIGSASTAFLNVKPLDKDRMARRFRFRAQLPLASTDTAAYNLTATDAVNLAKTVIANELLSWGDTDELEVDPNTPFNQLRALYATCEGKDFTINGFQLNAITGANIPIALSTTTTVTLEIVRPFVVQVGRGPEITDGCPGGTQVSQMKLGLTPGNSGFSTDAGKVTLAAGSAVTVQVIYDDMYSPDGRDVWANVVRIRQTSTPGEDIKLPLGPGGLIVAVMDMQQAASASPYTLISIDADGASPFQGLIAANQILQGFEDDLQGSFDWSTLWTPLYMAPPLSKLEQYEVGNVLTFHQPDNDASSPLITAVFFGALTNAKKDLVGANLVDLPGYSSFSLQTLAGTRGQALPEHAAAIAPLVISTPNSASYDLASGTRFAKGQPPQDVIAPALLNQAQSIIKSSGGTETPAGAAAAASSMRQIAAGLPGYSSPNRNLRQPTSAHLNVASAILTHGIPRNDLRARELAKAQGGALINRLFAK